MTELYERGMLLAEGQEDEDKKKLNNSKYRGDYHDGRYCKSSG